MKISISSIFILLTTVILNVSSKLILPIEVYAPAPDPPIPCSRADCNGFNLTNNIITKPISSYLDIQYLIELKFGESQNSFKLLIDTGSSWTWIPGFGFLNDYENLHYYDCLEMDGCYDTGDVHAFYYGKGQIQGEIVSGKICIDDINCIENQKFVIADQQYDLDGLRGDGLFGLGASSMMDNQTTVLENLYYNNIISELSFSLYMDGGVQRDEGTSVLILGGYDSKYMLDNFTFAPITDDYYWAINLTKIRFGNLEVNMENFKAVIDSGSSCLHFANTEYKQIMKEIRRIADRNNFGKLIEYSEYLFFEKGDFDLSIFPTFRFQINNTVFEVESKDYIIEIEGIYIVLIVSTPVDGLVILGDAFMHRVYTYFDIENKRIGFSRNVPRDQLQSCIEFYQVLGIVMALFTIFYFIYTEKKNKKTSKESVHEKIIEMNKSSYVKNTI